jgi:hypothetical protein
MDKPARCDLRHNGLPKAAILKNRRGYPNQVTTFPETQLRLQANLAEGASGAGVDNSGYTNWDASAYLTTPDESHAQSASSFRA